MSCQNICSTVSPFRKRVVALGDCALVVVRKYEIKKVTLTSGGVTQTRFGALRHCDCVDKVYGSKVRTSRGFVHLLPLDPVLWATSLTHRTQIIYPPDASLIVGGLDLIPGYRVFEAGTGSASLTHFLVQAIWPTGCVHTFEFHAERAEQARVELQQHIQSDAIRVTHRDVCVEGFPNSGTPENKDGVDAVILDLPQPWLVIPDLPKVFRQELGGRVCSFSPCVEQTQKTCAALSSAGFAQLQTIECLQRSYKLARTVLSVPNMGQVDKSALVKPRFLLPPPSEHLGGKRKHSNTTATEELDETGDHSSGDEESSALEGVAKCAKLELNTGVVRIPRERDDQFSWEAIPQPTMTGHTGYLTFASWLPRTRACDRFAAVILDDNDHPLHDALVLVAREEIP